MGDHKGQLLDFLRAKRLLLVLDNFEHLLDAATLLVEFLHEAPGVKLLVTSRERLNLRAEWLLPVTGLPFPTGVDAPDAEQFDAVRLFARSTQRVSPIINSPATCRT